MGAGAQASVYGALIGVRAREAVREVEEAEGGGRVCTPALSTFQWVCLLLCAICICATSF